MESRYDCGSDKSDPESRLRVRSNFGIGIESIVGRDNVILLGSHPESTFSLLIPVGRKLGILDVGNDGSMQSMRFLPLPDNVMEITALTISSDFKCVAVCARLDNDVSQTTVHRLKNFRNTKAPFKTLSRKKVSLSLTYTCAAFSGDSEQLILSCDNSLEVWRWEHEKLQYVTSIQDGQTSKVLCAPFSSIQSPLFTTSGKRHMQMWTATVGDRFCNKTLISNISNERSIDICDHVWLRSQDNPAVIGRLVAVCRGQHDHESIALIFHVTRDVETFLMKQHAQTTIDTTIVPGKIVMNCISPFLDGFIVSGSLGFLASFQPEKDNSSGFVQVNAIQSSPADSISCVSRAAVNDRIILYSDNSKRVYAYFSESPLLEREHLVEIFSNKFHHDGIIDCDVSKSQRLCITASKDNCVKIW